MQFQQQMENVKMRFPFLDEFANLRQNAIRDFNKKISTVRIRGLAIIKCTVKL